MRELLRRTGLNRAVIYGILAKATFSVTSLASVVLIAIRFPPVHQGYYFTFANLVGLQVVAELGLTTVIIQFASHEWAGLKLDPSGRVTGDARSKSRLTSIGRFAFAWLIPAGVVMAILVGVSGWLFLSRSDGSVGWQGPWLALCILAGVRMWTLPALSMLEGCNQVAQVYFLRWMMALLSGLVVVGGIIGGLGLWAAAAGMAVEIGWCVSYLFLKYRTFLLGFFAVPEGPRVNWRREIAPFQLRIAISWACGYIVYSLFTPVLFHYHGPAEAGRWGMTWSMFSGITGVALLWVTTRAPQFGIWIARREFELLDRSFWRLTVVSALVAAAGVTALWSATHILRLLGHPLAQRLLPSNVTSILALAAVLMQVPLSQAVYLRAHQREPFLWGSVLQAALTCFTTIFLGKRFGAMGMALGYLAGVILVVPMVGILWYHCRNEWHALEENEPETGNPPSSNLPT